MTTDHPPSHRPRHRAPRQRSRDFAWWDEREKAETVPCPGVPHGCGAAVNVTCRNPRSGVELQNFVAHEARIRRATSPDPGDGPRPRYAGDPAPAEETPR